MYVPSFPEAPTMQTFFTRASLLSFDERPRRCISSRVGRCVFAEVNQIVELKDVAQCGGFTVVIGR